MRSWLLLLVVGCGGAKPEAAAPQGTESQDPAMIEMHNKAVPYINQAVDAQNQGDWQAARKALQECVAEVGYADCSKRLEDLESRHRF